VSGNFKLNLKKSSINLGEGVPFLEDKANRTGTQTGGEEEERGGRGKQCCPVFILWFCSNSNNEAEKTTNDEKRLGRGRGGGRESYPEVGVSERDDAILPLLNVSPLSLLLGHRPAQII